MLVKQLRIWRLAHGLTQRGLAAMLTARGLELRNGRPVSKKTVYCWETGRHYPSGMAVEELLALIHEEEA